MKKTTAAVAAIVALAAVSSYQIDDKTWLVRQAVNEATTTAAKPVVKPTNHFLVLDCSGSMYNELPQITKHLQDKLPSLLGVDDTITIIWFSGRGQFGTLCEGKKVSNLVDLEQTKKDIGKWLRCVGLTGFKEPIQELKRVVARVSKAYPNAVNSGFFMSDGGENQWDRSEVLAAIKDSAGCLDAMTVVEYGNYADRSFLTSMASSFGGTIIQASSFARYEPIFESALSKRPTGAKRIAVKLDATPIGDFAYMLHNGDLVTYNVESGTIAVPADANEVFYLSTKQVGEVTRRLSDIAKSAVGNPVNTTIPAFDAALGAAYAAVALYAQRMDPNTVLAVLSALGDVAIVKQYGGCFGNQAYAEMADTARLAAFNDRKRFVGGYNAKAVPPEDAFCVRTLLDLLQSDPANRVLLDKIDYKSIGLKRVDTSAVLTDNDVKAISALNAKLQPGCSAEDAEIVRLEVAKIIASKGEPLKFQKGDVDGYPCTSLVYNETRANVSIRISQAGLIDISKRRPAEFAGKVPDVLSSHRYKTYTIIKDGIRNMDMLPVRVTQKTLKAMRAAGYEYGSDSATLCLDHNDMIEIDVNLAALPIINRTMVKATSAKVFAEKAWSLFKAQAAAKVYKDYAKAHSPKESKGFVEAYGKEAETWLKTIGITEGGFSPKGAQAKSVDVYTAKELEAKVKGFPALPSLNEVKKNVAAKKALNTSSVLMLTIVDECDAKLAADPKGFGAWVTSKSSAAIDETRDLLREISAVVFGVIVGQVWFNDLAPTATTLTIATKEGPITVEFVQREIEENI